MSLQLALVLVLVAVDSTVRAGAVPFTVSGLSSGAFMAVQMQVAHSSRIPASAVLAGGPCVQVPAPTYWCAEGNVETALTDCMADPNDIDLGALWTATDFAEAALSIDLTTNLSDRRVYLFHGSNDTVVDGGVVQALYDYYAHYMRNATSQIKMVYVRPYDKVPAVHSMVTADYGNPCDVFSEPFIVNCGFDLAGDLLQFLFSESLTAPTAADRNQTMLQTHVQTLSQEKYLPLWLKEAPLSVWGLGSEAFVFVPPQCASPDTAAGCRLHVAFHGCLQTVKDIGTRFVMHAGYLPWAMANNLVVLFPQAVANDLNPKGCWDWWGYSGEDYATRWAAQIGTTVAMADHILDELA